MIIVVAERDQEITDLVNALVEAAEKTEDQCQARRWTKLADSIEAQREVLQRKEK